MAGGQRRDGSPVFRSVIRPARAIAGIPASTPFIGPEQLMRESGRGELLRLGANESAFGPSPKAVSAMAGQLHGSPGTAIPIHSICATRLRQNMDARRRMFSSVPASTISWVWR